MLWVKSSTLLKLEVAWSAGMFFCEGRKIGSVGFDQRPGSLFQAIRQAEGCGRKGTHSSLEWVIGAPLKVGQGARCRQRMRPPSGLA